MSNTKPGGPAFPAVKIISGDNYNPPTKVYHGGMTLRDYFAAKAMPIAAGGLNHPGEDFVCNDQYSRLAQDAYKLADAMLEEREA